jgi:hypothetical protein
MPNVVDTDCNTDNPIQGMLSHEAMMSSKKKAQKLSAYEADPITVDDCLRSKNWETPRRQGRLGPAPLRTRALRPPLPAARQRARDRGHACAPHLLHRLRPRPQGSTDSFESLASDSAQSAAEDAAEAAPERRGVPGPRPAAPGRQARARDGLSIDTK